MSDIHTSAFQISGRARVVSTAKRGVIVTHVTNEGDEPSALIYLVLDGKSKQWREGCTPGKVITFAAHLISSVVPTGALFAAAPFRLDTEA